MKRMLGAHPPEGLGPTEVITEEWVVRAGPWTAARWHRPGRRVLWAGQGVGLRFPASLPFSVFTGFL